MSISPRSVLAALAGVALVLGGLAILGQAQPSTAQSGAQCLDAGGSAISGTLAVPIAGSAQPLITGTISTMGSTEQNASSIQRVCFKYPDPVDAGKQYFSNLKVDRQLTAIESGSLAAGRFQVELVPVPGTASMVVDSNATDMAMWDQQSNEHNVSIDRPAQGDALYDLKVSLTGSGPKGAVTYGIIPGGNTSSVKP